MDLLAGSLTPLGGGYSGETFLAEAAGEQSVVRIYGERSAWRGPHAVEVDAAVLRLVRGLLPVAEVLELRRPDEVAGTPAVLVTSRLRGARLDTVLPDAPGEHRRLVGGHLGRILGRLGTMPFLRAGMFVDGELRVGPMPDGGTDLVDWVKTHLPATALTAWSERDRSALLGIAEEAESILDQVDRVCLVHSDFNPKNLLVDPGTGKVTGLVDWEFAHAGSPYTDLGNLLRFDRDPDFTEAVLTTYTDVAPGLDTVDRQGVVDLARAADLWALVDLAARRDANQVARRAHDQLLAVVTTGDLHAAAGWT